MARWWTAGLLGLLGLVAGCGGADDRSGTAETSLCEATACDRGICDPETGACRCEVGWGGAACDRCAPDRIRVAGECFVAECVEDAGCDNGLACDGAEVCVEGRCAPGEPVSCGVGGACAEPDGACACAEGWAGERCARCAEGFVAVDGAGCLPGCDADARCDDGLSCNGAEACEEGACVPGDPMDCGPGGSCEEPGSCRCAPGYALEGGRCAALACAVPDAPMLTVVHGGVTLEFTTPGGEAIEVGVTEALEATEPDRWSPDRAVTMPSEGLPRWIKVFARVAEDACRTPEATFTHVYEVRDGYAPPPGEEGATAVSATDARLSAWATGWQEAAFGEAVDDAWKTPELALGPAEGTTSGVVSLGRGGSIVLTFDVEIVDGPGADFAVFENSFNDVFLELAFVEVSSDGVDFARFDVVVLTDGAVGPFGLLEPTELGQVAGRVRQGWGEPFDLANLASDPAVWTGRVDVQAIRYVRIVDIVGDGQTLDSLGHPIYDAYPTTGSAGFDLDAIGVLHAR